MQAHPFHSHVNKTHPHPHPHPHPPIHSSRAPPPPQPPPQVPNGRGPPRVPAHPGCPGRGPLLRPAASAGAAGARWAGPPAPLPSGPLSRPARARPAQISGAALRRRCLGACALLDTAQQQVSRELAARMGPPIPRSHMPTLPRAGLRRRAAGRGHPGLRRLRHHPLGAPQRRVGPVCDAAAAHAAPRPPLRQRQGEWARAARRWRGA
jgi:hypothetical protein